MPGIFITLEGTEGVGKSTALGFLEFYFKELNLDYVITREPGGTEIAEAIRQVLLNDYPESMAEDTELLLMFASRAQHLARVIKPALRQGKVVLSDRFTDATFAYQGGGRKVDVKRIEELERFVQEELQPDLTILLDAPIEIGMGRILARGAKDRIEKEKVEFFERVRQGYLERAKQYPQRFRLVDASLTVEQVQTRLREIISEFLGRCNVGSHALA